MFKKGLILVSIPLLFQLVFVGLVAQMQRKNAEAQAWSSHSKEVIVQAQTVLMGLVDAQAGGRGFLITGNPVFTELHDRAAAEIPKDLEALQRLVRDNPEQEVTAKRIAAKAARVMAWHAELLQLVREGAGEKAAAQVKSLQGKNLMDDVRQDLDAFLTEETRLDRARHQSLQRSQQLFNWLLLAGAVVSLLSTVGLAFVFSRGIGGRLTTLIENARRLVQGKELARPIGGTDEIAQLDRAMAQGLAASEEALRKQAQILQSVLDSMGDGVVVADEQGKFLVFNPSAERILGVGRTEAEPSEWSQRYGVYLPDGTTAYPPDEFPLARAIRGEVVDAVELFVRNTKVPGGVWISVSGRPLQDKHGTLRGGLVVLRDVTERRQAEEALRRSEVRFRLLVESAVDYALIILDPEGRVASWNAGAERIKGYRADEIIGKHFSCFYPPEGIERGWPQHELEVAAQLGKFEDEGWRVRRDGSRFWANVVVTALRNTAGQLEGFSKLTRDLTERKRAEEALRQLNEELEQRVLERTAELAEANRDLAHKNQENEMFVYSVSHDLRSPLVNLQGFSKELGPVCEELRTILTDNGLPPAVRERGLALVDADMCESIRFIQTAVMRLSSIIDALLRLSQAGRVEYQWQQVAVNPIVARVVEAMTGTITQRRAMVTVKDMPPVWGDPTAVEQIFANLIGNALNYLDAQRPGLIEVGADNLTRDGESRSPSGFHTYHVKDNGLGIPEAYRPKVFQAFQRLHPEVAKGEGMGLALVRRIVERHGGKIWLESTEGVGSTFFVSMPVRPVSGASQRLSRK